MSAIAVVYNLDGRPSDPELMDRMLGTLKHRGGDGCSVWSSNSIIIGHRMAWSTPESLQETLPLRSPESGSVITCDARIDNRRELIQELGIGRNSTADIADSEIILKSYDKWGEACFPKLIGDFVIIIWDSRNRKLICARDSMGVKHFYYHYVPGKYILIASEAKALFEHPFVPRDIDETFIGDALILNPQDKEITPFRYVKRIPPNSTLVLDSNSIRLQSFWRPSESLPQNRSDSFYEETFRDLLTEAVTCRQRNLSPVGSLLSGGLDSSAISCIAAKNLRDRKGERLETFSAIFPRIAEVDSRIDERKYVDLVARRTDCKSNLVEADTFSPFVDMDKIQYHTDHYVGAPNIFMDWALLKAAKGRKIGVLLSGLDGDSTVSYGYEGLPILARRGKLFRLISDARALSRNMPSRQHNLRRLVWRAGFKAAVPELAVRGWRRLNGRSGVPEEQLPSYSRLMMGWLNREFTERQMLGDRYFNLLHRNNPKGVSEAESHWNALCGGLFAFALETMEKASAAFGMEQRYPFFDRRLIDFCVSLPAHQKLKYGWTRSIFRRAMSGILPPEVQWRADKANIGLSFKLNMPKYAQAELEGAVFSSEDLLSGYINPDSLKAAYDRYNRDLLGYDLESLFVLNAVYLSNWLRNISDRGHHSSEKTAQPSPRPGGTTLSIDGNRRPLTA